MSDKDFYLQVEKEIASGVQDEAMLSKAKIMAEENGLSANVNYTKLRVAELKSIAMKEKAVNVAVTSAEVSKTLLSKLMPVALGLLVLFLIVLFISIQQEWS
jgi:hypothetical protein